MNNRIIDFHLNTLLNHIPGAWGYKDINSVFIYANDEYKKIVGLRNNENIKGMTDYDLPELTINGVRFFRQQDQQILQTGQPSKIVDIFNKDGSWKAYFFIKYPLFNKDQTIEGIIFHGQDVTDILTIELGSVLLQNFLCDHSGYSIDAHKYIHHKNTAAPKLSNRQAEVLFYLLRGKTIKETAKSLNISLRTAEEYLQQLKEKFAVSSKYELIEKSLSLGYLSTIPSFLFKNPLLLEM